MSGEPILIVDDHAGNMKLLSFMLTSRGYDVRTASNAEEALLVLREFHPRLILMDIQLPGIDGLALTRQLKADPAYRSTVVIAVTASAMKGDEERALKAGCDGYVTKPIDTRALPRIVASYLSADSRGV
jgi:two-component system, cell cycle response regulator DivK